MLFRKLLNYSSAGVRAQYSEICADIAEYVEILLNQYRFSGVWSKRDASTILPFSNLENDIQFNSLVTLYVESVVNRYERRLSGIHLKTFTSKNGDAAIRTHLEGNITAVQQKFVASIILNYRLRFEVLT
jgi:hypothetical protein